MGRIALPPHHKEIMKTSKKDYQLFKDECTRLIKEWGLNGWNHAFEWINLKEANAKATLDGDSYNITFAIGKEIDFDKFDFNGIKKENFIKNLAKHEMIHLLLARLTHCAEARFCTDSEMNEAEEELVRKLMCIIK